MAARVTAVTKSFSDFDNTNEPNIGISTPVVNRSESVSNEQPCPADLALFAIEVSLRQDTLIKFKIANDNNKHITGDPIYTTWKIYKDNVCPEKSSQKW